MNITLSQAETIDFSSKRKSNKNRLQNEYRRS